MESRVLYLANAQETQRLGELIGAACSSGSLIALTGGLGAGKTCFTQGLAKALRVPEDIPVASPTFSLLHEYPGSLPLYHMDFYRLNAGEIEEMGLEETFESRGVFVAEWAEHWPEFLTWAQLHLIFQANRVNGRLVEVRTSESQFLQVCDTWLASQKQEHSADDSSALD